MTALLTINEAAAQLGVSASTVDKLAFQFYSVSRLAGRWRERWKTRLASSS